MQVLYVSKPVVPPWNDSSKNLVRDLASHLTRYEPRVLGRRDDARWRPPRGQVEPLYRPGAGGFAPGLRDNARVMWRLVAGPRADLWHFFFAPNPKSARAGKAASRLRHVPTIQTVCSAPAPRSDLADMLFADRTVVLSQHTEARLLDAGVVPGRLRRIPPGIVPLEPPTGQERADARRSFELPADAPLVVYPGDLEFGGGAERTLTAMVSNVLREAHLAMACRAKTPRAQAAEALLRERARELGIDGRVSWIGEAPRIHALLGAADVVALPADDLFAKMDYPLVLLEAMSLGRPVIVAFATPAAELADGGAAVVVSPEIEAVAEGIASVLFDADRAARVGRAARRAVLERHSPSAMAASYERLYDELL